MRKSEREITDINKIIEIIKKCDVCRLALHDIEYPYILPLNFGLAIEDHKITLYFHGANEGTKLDLIARDARASFEMDYSHKLVTNELRGSLTMYYESVIGNGVITILSDEEKYDALCLLLKHYHQEDFPFNKSVIARTTVFKLEVVNVTGKVRDITN